MKGHTEFAKEFQIGQISRQIVIQCQGRNRNLRPAMKIQRVKIGVKKSLVRLLWFGDRIHEIIGGPIYYGTMLTYNN